MDTIARTAKQQTNRVNEVQLTGSFGIYTSEPGRWYRVLRRNAKSYTVQVDDGIITASKTQVVAER